jgi:hypothetical protein
VGEWRSNSQLEYDAMHTQLTPDDISFTRRLTFILLPCLALLFFYSGSILVSQWNVSGMPVPRQGKIFLSVIFVVALVILYVRLIGLVARSKGCTVLQLLGFNFPVSSKRKHENTVPFDIWPMLKWDARLTLRFAIMWCAVVIPLVWFGARFIQSF